MSRFVTKGKEVKTVSGSIVMVTLHLERPDKENPDEMIETNCWAYLGTQNNWVLHSELVGGEMKRVEPALAPGDPALGNTTPAPQNNHFDMCNKYAKLHLLTLQYRTWLRDG